MGGVGALHRRETFGVASSQKKKKRPLAKDEEFIEHKWVVENGEEKRKKVIR